MHRGLSRSYGLRTASIRPATSSMAGITCLYVFIVRLICEFLDLNNNTWGYALQEEKHRCGVSQVIETDLRQACSPGEALEPMGTTVAACQSTCEREIAGCQPDAATGISPGLCVTRLQQCSECDLRELMVRLLRFVFGGENSICSVSTSMCIRHER
jgi:hypothetical protein